MWCFSLEKSMGVKGVYESIHSLKIFDLLACPRLSVNIEEAKVTEQEQWREVREKYSNLSYFKVTRASFFGAVPSYFEALWYPLLYFYRKSNT